VFKYSVSTVQQPHNHRFMAIMQVNLCQPASSVNNWRILLVQTFTPHLPLLMATSTFGLGRRRCSSLQQCYLYCLHTSAVSTLMIMKYICHSFPPYRSLSFFSFRIHYMDFPHCLLLLLSISVFLLFSFFSVFTLF